MHDYIVLCFDLLFNLIIRLGKLSIMEHLEKNKHVICEPRGGGQSAVKQVFDEYAGSLKNTNHALLFTVMRGKVSEGMDFADNFARCVVIAGIPYPYMKDPKIKEKKLYMDPKIKENKLYKDRIHSMNRIFNQFHIPI